MISTLANPSPDLRSLLYAVALLAGADEEQGERWLVTGVPLSRTHKAHAIVWLDAETGQPMARCYRTAALARKAWEQGNPTNDNPAKGKAADV